MLGDDTQLAGEDLSEAAMASCRPDRAAGEVLALEAPQPRPSDQGRSRS
jgi:hypothetical protein